MIRIFERFDHFPGSVHQFDLFAFMIELACEIAESREVPEVGSMKSVHVAANNEVAVTRDFGLVRESEFGSMGEAPAGEVNVLFGHVEKFDILESIRVAGRMV